MWPGRTVASIVVTINGNKRTSTYETSEPEPGQAGQPSDALQGRALATWTFCDKNRDGLLCVLTTEPSPYYYTLLDNRPFPG